MNTHTVLFLTARFDTIWNEYVRRKHMYMHECVRIWVYNVHIITATHPQSVQSYVIGKAHKLHFFHSVQIFYWNPLKNCSDHINIIIDVEFPFALEMMQAVCVCLYECLQAKQLNTHRSKCENSSQQQQQHQ